MLEADLAPLTFECSSKLRSRAEGVTCVVREAGARTQCGEKALPFTKHCIKRTKTNMLYTILNHDNEMIVFTLSLLSLADIALDDNQHLFERCSAMFADSTQCCAPVFDVARHQVLCTEHAKKAVSAE